MDPCPRCGAPIPLDQSRCPECGAAPYTMPIGAGRAPVTAVAPPPGNVPRFVMPGTMLGPYELGPRLGEGGMSAVYSATDRALDRQVAVKVLHPNLQGDEGIRRRFVREGRIARGWAHPNVVPVLDTVVDGEIVALVMERVDAPTLARVLEQWRDGLPLRELTEVADGLLAGLEAAHERGIVHRDLKPGNVLVEALEGRLVPRIIDFGIARVLEGTTYTLTGAVLGTCRYMSPEQVRGEPVDERSDLYTLGVVLFELATGEPPFDDPQPFSLMMSQVSKPPPRPQALRPDLPDALAALILDLLGKEPDARPGSATAVRARLRAVLDVSAAPIAPRAGPQPNDHVLVPIPGGTFAMGPTRRGIWLDRFSLDRLPVTNGQFHAFLRATGYRPDEPERFLSHWPSLAAGPSPAQRDHPVVFVAHSDAMAYAGWLGLRLPTEAEWEKAARGTDGRRYPWGNAPPSAERAWYGQRRGTAAVGGRPTGASPYGVEDLVGLVWEWCADEDDPAFSRDGPSHNPRLPVRLDSQAAVVRGGAWMFDDPKALRTTARAAFPPGSRLEYVGFRCAG